MANHVRFLLAASLLPGAAAAGHTASSLGPPGQFAFLSMGFEAYAGSTPECAPVDGSVYVGPCEPWEGCTDNSVAFQYDFWKAEGGVLTAEMAPYPGYSGEYAVTGTVSLKRAKQCLDSPTEDTTMTLTYDLEGVPASGDYGVHVHAGTSCDDPSEVKGHYWLEDKYPVDPWGADTLYTADADGKAAGSFDVNSGYLDENTHKTMVVHGIGGEKIACGILKPESFGVHIHSGDSCDEASSVGGHFWNADGGLADPWVPPVATYTPDMNGRASGRFVLDVGMPVSENAGKTVVVHGIGGVKRACTVLAPAPPATVYGVGMDAIPGYTPTCEMDNTHSGMALWGDEDGYLMYYSVTGGQPGELTTALSMKQYPGYTGEFDVKGEVKLSKATCPNDGSTKLKVSWDLTGLPPDGTYAMHAHSGDSCGAASMVGGHYWNPDIGPDPWDSTNTVYTTDALGSSVGEFEVDSGYLEENDKKTFVIHGIGGEKIACAVLQREYYGIHLHTGDSCDAVGAHLFSEEIGYDAWDWTYYTPDLQGNAAGIAYINIGISPEDTAGKAMVVHGAGGGKMLCGILSDEVSDTPGGDNEGSVFPTCFDDCDDVPESCDGAKAAMAGCGLDCGLGDKTTGMLTMFEEGIVDIPCGSEIMTDLYGMEVGLAELLWLQVNANDQYPLGTCMEPCSSETPTSCDDMARMYAAGCVGGCDNVSEIKGHMVMAAWGLPFFDKECAVKLFEIATAPPTEAPTEAPTDAPTDAPAPTAAPAPAPTAAPAPVSDSGASIQSASYGVLALAALVALVGF